MTLDEDHGESVRLGFGDLPEGVTASGTTTTTVTIIDDDPAVMVTHQDHWRTWITRG